MHGSGRPRNQRSCGDHPNSSIIKIIQKTKMNPGDLRRLSENCSERPSAHASLKKKNSLETIIIIIIIIIPYNNKKNRICKIIDFAVPADHGINLKECEKKDLARELIKLWSINETIVPVVIGAFGTITKGFLKGLEYLEVGVRVETIQMTVLLRTARILRRVLETEGDLLSLKLQWKTMG